MAHHVRGNAAFAPTLERALHAVDGGGGAPHAAHGSIDRLARRHLDRSGTAFFASRNRASSRTLGKHVERRSHVGRLVGVGEQTGAKLFPKRIVVAYLGHGLARRRIAGARSMG